MEKHTQTQNLEIKDRPLRYQNVIFQSGTHLVTILSAHEFISRKGRRTFCITVENKQGEYATICLALETPRGRVRKKEKELLESILVIADVVELAPIEGVCSIYSYKNRGLTISPAKASYPDLEGVELILELGCKRSYREYDMFINYYIHEIYHPITFQTADEIIKNITSIKFIERGLL